MRPRAHGFWEEVFFVSVYVWTTCVYRSSFFGFFRIGVRLREDVVVSEGCAKLTRINFVGVFVSVLCISKLWYQVHCTFCIDITPKRFSTETIIHQSSLQS